ncbi:MULTISPECIES: type II toxin-antitoxin system YoeB family toxin [Micromonospora]|uniref:type II toxin-antitoxin system YoeB family toxin n=1 Tax=Micromonospora haikouensis TaxID=686309 RepID=UPI0009E47E3F|nr:type II toxin-antitoxin system YoeB family toxin [Micromonospora haikouensis]
MPAQARRRQREGPVRQPGLGGQGIGKPEQLRGNWAGFWSRRIDQEHRLVCRIVGLTVLFAQ